MYEINGDNVEVTICHDMGDILITFPVDDLWDYIKSQGMNDMFEDDFNPSSMYGHTQRCWSISREDYLDGDIKSEIEMYLDASINLNLNKK
jgi:hypothetical protein